MAKKNAGKVIQMLTPENYIRSKSRTLPIYDCWINSDWEEGKMASVLISRQHTNGNITYCFYIVDLMCLGVKFTQFEFNIPMSAYQERLDGFNEDVELDPIDYPLAHNIIHAGLEFSELYEFKPYKEFTSVTQYFLEEDDDEIELMEIECGDEDGQPLFVYNKLVDSPQDIKRVIAQLERTAGTGNYSVIDSDEIDEEEDEEDPDDGDEDEDDDDDDYDIDQPIDIYEDKSLEEKKAIFIEYYKNRQIPYDLDELDRIVEIVDSIFWEITDEDIVNEYIDEFIDLYSIPSAPNYFPNEILGLLPEVKVDNRLKKVFSKIVLDLNSDPDKARKEIVSLQQNAIGLPGAAFLELILLRKERSPEYMTKLEKYATMYPDYALIKMTWLIEIYASGNVPKEIEAQSFSSDDFFPRRVRLSFAEKYMYLRLISFTMLHEGNLDKIEAFFRGLFELDDNEKLTYAMVRSSRISIGFSPGSDFAIWWMQVLRPDQKLSNELRNEKGLFGIRSETICWLS
jgi:hypothetical protein